ncbi:MAG: NADH-quinone oxidoreductase subunit J [Bacteroidota bacterium]
MWLEPSYWVFAFLTAMMLGGCGIMIFTRRLVLAGFGLFMVLFALAGYYAMLEAAFLAVSQVIVYVGGILVLLFFGIMLTQRRHNRPPSGGTNRILPAFALTSGFLAGMIYFIQTTDWDQLPYVSTVQNTPDMTNTAHIGVNLLTGYLLPFEIASVLLLIALIGATFIARNSSKVPS